MKRTWLKTHFLSVWWLGPAIAGWAFVAFSSATRRGFDTSGVWQLEQAESAGTWLSALVSSPGAAFSEEALRAAFVTDPFRGPMVGLVSALFGSVPPIGGDLYWSVYGANMLVVCLTAWCVFSLARRAGGALAGLGAAVFLLSVPRVWAAATSPGLTAVTMFALVVGPFFMERARDRFSWFVPAVLVLAMAMLTSQIALLLGLPWVYVTFFTGKPSSERGMLASRPLSFWGFWVFPAAFALVFLAFLLSPGGGKQQLLHFLKAFVSRPRTPTLYFGQVFAEKRLSWHAAPGLTALTVPPMVLFMTLYGLIVASPLTGWLRRRLFKPASGGESGERQEALRLAWSMLLLTLALPLLFGTTYSHGADLLALIVPWCAVFAGVGVARLATLLATRIHTFFSGRQWARLCTLTALGVLVWSVFVFALIETDDAYPEVESYYNRLVGGVDSAAEMGLPRYPHGPLVPQFLDATVTSPEHTSIAVIGATEETWPILERYRQLGLVSTGLTPSPLQSADAVLFCFDELSIEFYSELPDFLSAAQSVGPDRVHWLDREGLPLFGAVSLGQ